MKKIYLQVALMLMICGFTAVIKASANKDTAVISTGINAIENIQYVASTPLLVKSNSAAKTALGFSKNGRAVEAYYFPGTSDKKALVIAGVHGSELSSVAIARSLIQYLKNSPQAYYSVIVIPVLFPDNAVAAQNKPELIGGIENNGRYSCGNAADPNRQMPSLGKPYHAAAKDHLGRAIETENKLLLELINIYRPQRIVNIHAIRNPSKAGIYADPRTDANGLALGYETDSSLAIEMAKYVHYNGGFIPGNHIDSIPSSLYYCDFPAAATGTVQQRNLHGSKLSNHRGEGVSLGGWASTAVEDMAHPGYNRDAMRILTMEFPGYKRPEDYTYITDQKYIETIVNLYAASIQNVFLQKYFEE